MDDICGHIARNADRQCRANSDHRPNDLRALVADLPALAAIGFNGGTAARIGRRRLGAGGVIDLIDLPSSSPAYTMAFAAKRDRWMVLRPYVGRSAGDVE